MAAIETALAVTLLPHFIADTSFVLRYELPNHQPYITTHPPSQELLEDTAGLWWQKKEAAADVDKLEILDYGGCPTDLKEAWTDVEENLNVCEKGSRDQSWSPSRAVMSMACRNTTAIIDPAVRMNSTLYGVFFSMLKFSLAHIPVLSSPSVQAVFIAPSATQHRQGGLSLRAILSRQSQNREKAHSAVALWASCILMMDV
jgi:hypothetical protein